MSGPEAISMLAADDDLLALANSYAKELRQRATEFEEQGFVAPDLAQRLASAGLFRLCNPPQYGGPGRSPTDYAHLVETLSSYDAATGWVVFIGITSAQSAMKLGPQVSQQMLASPTSITAGVFAPLGRAVACVEDGVSGFRLSGRWQWGSGTNNASFVSGGGFVVDAAGDFVQRPDGGPDQRSFFMPAKAIALHDTWHVSGLKGTGSTDFSADNVFVPATMTCDPFAPSSGTEPIHRFPDFAFLGIGIGAVALGLASASLEEFLALANAKKPQGSNRSLAMKTSTQRRVAQASASLRAARLLFHDAIDRAWQQALQGQSPTLSARGDIRLATTYAVNTAAEVIDNLYTLAGGSAVYLKSPLQRHFRDIHVATQHMMVNETSLELVGKILLGVEFNSDQI